MARLFDNNVANYMKRATVDFGLNTLTECSYAITLKLIASTGTTQRINSCDSEGVNGRPFRINWDDPGGITCGITNTGGTQAPDWAAALPAYGVGTRVLFTFKRNNIDTTDGIIYYNGVSQTITTFSASGYAAGFTIGEASHNYYLGIRAITFVGPVNGTMGYATVWNRQLTAAEALADYISPTVVSSGMKSSVQLCPDTDIILGGSMTVNGSLACTPDPWFAAMTPSQVLPSTMIGRRFV